MKWELIRNLDNEVMRTFNSEEDASAYRDLCGTLYLPSEYTFRERVPMLAKLPAAPKSRANEDSHDRQKRIRESLNQIDNDDDIDVTTWEAGFLESVIRGDQTGKYLSERQILVAESMIEKYLGK